MKPAVVLPLATMLTVTALAACGGSSSPPAASSNSGGGGSPANPLSTVNPGGAGADVCADIGADGARAILGTDVGAPKKDANVPYPNCLYSGTGSGFATVSMVIFQGAQAAQGLIAGAAQVSATTSVPGVGDQAFADDKGQVLFARKGDVGCSVTVAGDSLAGTPQTRIQQMASFCTKAFG